MPPRSKKRSTTPALATLPAEPPEPIPQRTESLPASPPDSPSPKGSTARRKTRNSKRASVVPKDYGQGAGKEPSRTDENVFLFVPNLIGYTRVILAVVALSYMPTHPKYSTVAYLVSALLDAVDGQAARALNQTSKFGAVLDMVTDRCATSCLLCFLSSAYPKFALLFQFLITLDFSSHYIHMYNSLTSGATSHKLVSRETSRILWSYYNNNRTLFFFCAGNELHFVCLYLMNYYTTPLGISSAHHILPYLAHVHPDAVKYVPIAVWSAIDRLTWPQLLAVWTFPVCAIKQIINVVQFWKASKGLTELDREERYVKFHGKEE